MTYLTADPDGKLDYKTDWTSWLGVDTISTSSWSIDPSTDVTLSGQDLDGATATVFVENLQPNTVYKLTNSIETAQGRKSDRSFTIRATER